MKKCIKETLKSLKEKAEVCLNEEDYEQALIIGEKIKKTYSKNYYGYYLVIKSKTKNYKEYLSEEELKLIKKDFEDFMKLYKKNDKDTIKAEFEEYLEDCLEVVNLKKIKKELTSKYFLKCLYNEGITFINQNINTINSYNLSGKKITNIYDLIKGMFLLSCLIFNLINRNYFLILTIPFGIFSVITIYSFFSMNFFGDNKLKSEKDYVRKIINNANYQIINIKNTIEKTNETIEFLITQKKSLILKIPEVFLNEIKGYVDNDEQVIAEGILNELLSGNISAFTYLINERTNLNVDDVLQKIKPEIINEDNDLTKFISNKVIEKKNNQNEVILMKKVKKYNYFIILIFLLISILSIIILFKNFSEINTVSFVFATITGIVSALIYNINTGKHSTLVDTFNDNLLSCIFNATLVYDLIYSSINDNVNFLYGFIQMPIIFILTLIGIVAVISLLKYNYLVKKLSSV